MTDDELLEAYHAALCRYAGAKSGHGNRVVAFVSLTSAQMALIGRFGSSDYLWRYCQRYEADTDTDALGISGVAKERPALDLPVDVSGQQKQMA